MPTLRTLALKPPVLTRIALILAVLAFAIPAGGSAAMTATEGVDARVEGATYEVTYRMAIPLDALNFDARMGYHAVSLEGAGYLKQAGSPALPAWTADIAIPQGMKVTGLREVEASKVALPGTFNILPAQLPRAITGEPSVPERTFPDPAVYSSAELYPASRVEFMRQADLAGQSIASIRVCPLQYRPLTGELYLATEIEVVLEGKAGNRCGDCLAPGASRRSRAAHLRMLESIVINPQDVRLVEAFPGPLLGGVAPGQYDYVIVTQDAWVDDFAPLAEWRARQGYRVNTVTTEWIFTSGEYTGSDLEKMRAFVADAHATWGTTHFVLAADTNIIPYDSRSITVPTWQTDILDNDVYYADYDDDFVLEVSLGRLPVRTETSIADILNKIFTYEKTPPLTGYARTALFIGMDITVCDDMDGENFKENYIRAGHLPGTWSLDTEYDSEPGTHKSDIIAYLESGYHIVNHHDHCNIDCMGAGWTCHGELFMKSDMNALTNGDRLSIFLAVGCFPAHHPTRGCIGEAALRNPDGAGIAFMGNVSYGWGGPVEDPDMYSCRQDRLFYRNLFDLGVYNLGENFTRLKNDEYDPDDPYNLHEYAFFNFHLVGDPGLTIWTDDPQTLTVTHPVSVPPGEVSTFEVEVAGGSGPLDGASVCLHKDGDVHEVQETTGGQASFSVAPATEGTLHVTVCCHNYIPYEGSSAVDANASAEGLDPDKPARFAIVSATPTPFRQSTTISYFVPDSRYAEPVMVHIYDCRGRRVRSWRREDVPAGFHAVTWNGMDAGGSEVASGIYYCEVRWRDQRDARQLVLLR